MLKKTLLLILVSLTQVVLYCLIHIVALKTQPLSRGDVNWGISVHFQHLFYISFVVVSNLIFFQKKLDLKWTLITIILIIISNYPVLSAITSRPLRAPFLILTGLILSTFSYLAIKKIKTLHNT